MMEKQIRDQEVIVKQAARAKLHNQEVFLPVQEILCDRQQQAKEAAQHER